MAFLKASRFESRRGSYTSRRGGLSSSRGHLFLLMMLWRIDSFLRIYQMKANTRAALAKEQNRPSLCIWSVFCHSNTCSHKLRVKELKTGAHSVFSELLRASSFVSFLVVWVFFGFVFGCGFFCIQYNCSNCVSCVFFACHFLRSYSSKSLGFP